MIPTDSDTVAIVGFVDVNIKNKNALILYQFTEYIYAQCLRRKFQSEFTYKVNCLSGCNQLIKICNETCGEDILNLFNKKPNENDNIFNMILTSASEDRNHVTLMFKLYPNIKTIQDLNAIVYTNVPRTLNKFLIQRKRWTLGALCNDVLLILNRKHNTIERIQSAINVFVNIINIFILISTGYFIYAIIYNASIIMLYLSILIFVLIGHILITPLIYYKIRDKRIIYYYIGTLLYFILAPFLSFMQHIYTIINLDNFNWNKKDVNKDVNKEEIITRVITLHDNNILETII
jgi:chitin synthase